MGLFSSKLKKEFGDGESGVKEMRGGDITGVMAEDAPKLVKNICEGTTEGFFIAIEKTPGAKAGVARLHGMNKREVLEVVFKSLGMPFKDVVAVALLKEIEDEDDTDCGDPTHHHGK